MLMVIGLLSAVLGIVSLVCLIMTLIKIFQDNVVMGIIGIVTCGLFAFIYGWIKAEEYQNKKIMLIWTGCWVGSLLLNGLAFAMAPGMGQ